MSETLTEIYHTFNKKERLILYRAIRYRLINRDFGRLSYNKNDDINPESFHLGLLPFINRQFAISAMLKFKEENLTENKNIIIWGRAYAKLVPPERRTQLRLDQKKLNEKFHINGNKTRCNMWEAAIPLNAGRAKIGKAVIKMQRTWIYCHIIQESESMFTVVAQSDELSKIILWLISNCSVDHNIKYAGIGPTKQRRIRRKKHRKRKHK